MTYDRKPYVFRHAFTGRFCFTGLALTDVYSILGALRLRADALQDGELLDLCDTLENQVAEILFNGKLAIQDGRCMFVTSADGSGKEASTARAV